MHSLLFQGKYNEILYPLSTGPTPQWDKGLGIRIDTLNIEPARVLSYLGFKEGPFWYAVANLITSVRETIVTSALSRGGHVTPSDLYYKRIIGATHPCYIHVRVTEV